MNGVEVSNITVVAKVVTPDVVVLLNSKNIIEIEWNSTIEEIDKHHIEQTTQIVGELGGGKRLPVFVNTYSFMAMTNKAKEYMATPESYRYTLANAVLIDTLAKRILFNFFVKHMKRGAPIKSFSTKQEAFEWLLSLND